MGITCESLAVGGYSAFLAKFVHLQFHVTEGDSSLYTGMIMIAVPPKGLETPDTVNTVDTVDTLIFIGRKIIHVSTKFY